jgi:hypothetical protein
MSERHKVTAQHRRRRAGGLCAPVDADPLERNSESRARQYALRERATGSRRPLGHCLVKSRATWNYFATPQT